MEYIILALIFILAGIVPELTGFGVAIVSMALIPFILPLSITIPLVAIISMIATGMVAFQTKTKGILKYLQPLLLGSIIGVTLGMSLLHFINEQLLTILLGVFLITYSVYGLFFKGHFLPTGKITGTITGIVAGFLGSSFNVHGPLVGLYSSSNNGLSKLETKDLMATYMSITGAFTVIGHSLAGRISSNVLFYVLISIPFLFLGLEIGKIIFKKINIIWIKKGIYLFVLMAGIAFII